MPPPDVYPRGCTNDQTTGEPAPGGNQEGGVAKDDSEAEDNPEGRVVQLQRNESPYGVEAG